MVDVGEKAPDFTVLSDEGSGLMGSREAQEHCVVAWATS